jgi:hypothetical protein
MGMSGRLLRPRATGFNPRSIANLALWLDASDLTTGAVASWTDKSDNARVLSQSVANNRPSVVENAIGTKKAVRFDGSNDRLTSTADAGLLVSPVTFFCVARKAAATADGCLFTHEKTSVNAYDGPDVWCMTTNSNGSAIRCLGGTSGNTSLGVGAVGDTLGAFLTTFRSAGTNDATIRNRTAGLTASDTSSSFAATPSNNGCTLGALAGFGFGANFYIHPLNGDIAEIIAYSRALSATEQDRVANYLAAKYGFTLA